MKRKPDLMRPPCFGNAMDQTRSAVIAQALEGGHAGFGLEMFLLQGCRHAEVGQRGFDSHLGLRKRTLYHGQVFFAMAHSSTLEFILKSSSDGRTLEREKNTIVKIFMVTFL